jgi:peroxiredoxin
MVFCFLTYALLTREPTDQAEWLLAPHLAQGQELVYRGTMYEEAHGQGVQFTRSYRLENRAFVLDRSAQGFEVAFYTVLKLRHPAKPEKGLEQPGSARLEVALVDPHGRIVSPTGVSFAVPLDGPATVECGAFVEFPEERVGLYQSWEKAENNRPVQVWKIAGMDDINGTRCLKLDGLQQSDEWEHPRADRGAWRRRDLVWVLPNSGVVVKVERTIEKREPAHQVASQRSFVQYELQDNLEYKNQLFDDRRHEIQQACKFNSALAPFLSNPAKFGSQPFDRIISLIAFHLQSQPPTPYRDAVLQAKRNAEAGRKGEAPPALPREEPVVPVEARLGNRAPEFVATDLISKELARSRKWMGRPVVLVFYNPGSPSAEEVLRFAQSLQDLYHHRVNVLGLAICDDAEKVRQQHQDLKLSYPILSGNGLRQTYTVDATPKLIVIDAAAILRGIHDGWGPETPSAVRDDLKRCVQADDRFRTD